MPRTAVLLFALCLGAVLGCGKSGGDAETHPGQSADQMKQNLKTQPKR